MNTVMNATLSIRLLSSSTLSPSRMLLLGHESARSYRSHLVLWALLLLLDSESLESANNCHYSTCPPCQTTMGDAKQRQAAPVEAARPLIFPRQLLDGVDANVEQIVREKHQEGNNEVMLWYVKMPRAIINIITDLVNHFSLDPLLMLAGLLVPSGRITHSSSSSSSRIGLKRRDGVSLLESQAAMMDASINTVQMRLGSDAKYPPTAGPMMMPTDHTKGMMAYAVAERCAIQKLKEKPTMSRDAMVPKHPMIKTGFLPMRSLSPPQYLSIPKRLGKREGRYEEARVERGILPVTDVELSNELPGVWEDRRERNRFGNTRELLGVSRSLVLCFERTALQVQVDAGGTSPQRL
ncbi:hypothetical protein KC335_g34 [Hortaea werneckii]|nr:hypothetical protein KC335_g34 [Hortaea werneckii]